MISFSCTTTIAASMDKTVIYHEDGSYSIIEVERLDTTRATNKVTGSTYENYYSANGTLEWKAALRATFSYTGSSATCTSVDSFTVTIYNSNWSVASKTTRKNGAVAYGDLTMKKTITGGYQEVPVTVTLTCDKNGNLS